MGGFVRKIIKRKKPTAIQKAAVKSAPAGPTSSELAQTRMLSSKRRGRKSTNLGVSDEDLTLSFKTLLG